VPTELFTGLARGLLALFIVAGIMAAADSLRRTGNFELDALFAGMRKPAPMLVIGAWVMLTLVAFYALMAIGVSFEVANQVVLGLGGPVETDPEWVFSRGFGLAAAHFAPRFTGRNGHEDEPDCVHQERPGGCGLWHLHVSVLVRLGHLHRWNFRRHPGHEQYPG
jgi:hypothetical protein